MATSGQHVGGLRDALVEDEDLTAARRNQKVLAAAVRPRALPRSFHDIGDGDRCPLVSEHGKMVVFGQLQYCPHQTHDGVWGGPAKLPPTRSLWPLHGLEAAVSAYHVPEAPAASELPDLDIGELNA